MNRQYEIARAMTGTNTADEVIFRELQTLNKTEWEQQCVILDDLLQKHSMPFDKGLGLMINDIQNISVANSISEATVFVAYMDWLSANKIK